VDSNIFNGQVRGGILRKEEWSLSPEPIEAGDRPSICDKQMRKEASMVKLCCESMKFIRDNQISFIPPIILYKIS